MDATTLSKIYALDGPFTTIYLDASSATEDAVTQYDIRWKNVVRDLEERGVDAATREAISAARGDHGRGNTRIVVATPGAVQLAISLPQPPSREEIVVGPLPRLEPLVDALSLQIPHVLVLADRKGADVLAFTAGPDPVESGSVTNDRFPDRKVHAGGWAAKRYANDVEETWEQNARDVAGLVEQVAQDISARIIIGSGDERAIQLLGQHLPTQLVDRFVEVGGGGRHVDGSEDVIADEVLRVLAETATADTIELLEEFSEQRGRSDRASDGVADTIEALRKGQVGTLILTDARDTDRAGWFGPDPTHLALAEQELRDMGVEQPVEGPLEEILVRAALGTAAEIRVVAGDLEQSPTDGVGALLRYAD